MRKRHSLKYFFLVTTFCISIYNTYLIAKLRWKIDLEINWFMETPLHGHKGGDHSGLWAPKEKNLSRKVRFLLLLAPMTVRTILSFFSYCLRCHKKLVKKAIISNNQLLRFFCSYKQAGIVHQQLYIQHTPSRLSFGNWVYKSPIYLNQQFFFQIEVNSGEINRGEVNISDHSRQLSARTFSPSATCTAEHQEPERGGGGGGRRATRQSFIQGKYSQGSNPLPFSIPFLTEKGPLSYTFY